MTELTPGQRRRARWRRLRRSYVSHNGGRVQVNLWFPDPGYGIWCRNTIKQSALYWIPYNGGSPLTTQYGLLNARGMPSAMPVGGTSWRFDNVRMYGEVGDIWVLKWTGTATLGLTSQGSGSFVVDSSSSNRIEYRITAVPSPNATFPCYLAITALTDVPSNVVVCRAADEAGWDAGNYFTDEFIESLTNVASIRNMDWSFINTTNIARWEDRVLESDFGWAWTTINSGNCGAHTSKSKNRYTTSRAIDDNPSSWVDGRLISFYVGTPGTLLTVRSIVNGSPTRLSFFEAHGLSTGDYIQGLGFNVGQGAWQTALNTRGTGTGLSPEFQVTVIDSTTVDITIPGQTTTIASADAGTNVITWSAAHGYTTAQEIIASNGAGTLPTGLVNGTTYYVRVATTTTGTLHTTAGGASANTGVVDITGTGTGQTSWTIPGYTAGAAAKTIVSVNTDTDVITLSFPAPATSHGLSTGTAVTVYDTTGNLPTGLLHEGIYYARNLTSTTITLHPTAADANANTNIVNITLTGTGEISATPAGTVDTILGADASTNVVLFAAAHGYATGTPVIFYNGTGTLPGGMTNQTTYYVRSLTSTTVSLHSSASDAANNLNRVDITSTGNGYASATLMFYPRFELECGSLPVKRIVPQSGTCLNVADTFPAAGIYGVVYDALSDCLLHAGNTSATPKPGIPHEVFIKLCTAVRAHPEVNMSYLGSSDYFTRTATLFRDTLPLGLKPDFRVGNEIWNNIFQMYHRAKMESSIVFNTNGANVTDHHYGYGRKFNIMADAVDAVFASYRPYHKTLEKFGLDAGAADTARFQCPPLSLGNTALYPLNKATRWAIAPYFGPPFWGRTDGAASQASNYSGYVNAVYDYLQGGSLRDAAYEWMNQQFLSPTDTAYVAAYGSGAAISAAPAIIQATMAVTATYTSNPAAVMYEGGIGFGNATRLTSGFPAVHAASGTTITVANVQSFYYDWRNSDIFAELVTDYLQTFWDINITPSWYALASTFGQPTAQSSLWGLVNTTPVPHVNTPGLTALRNWSPSRTPIVATFRF